jgi:hypothetical protein
MTRALLLVGLVLGVTACRTTISPVPEGRQAGVYRGEQGCDVQMFPSANDIPKGSKNLGWVTVKALENDEATFQAMHKKICELGGDALSQAAWDKMPTGEHAELKANAWSLP